MNSTIFLKLGLKLYYGSYIFRFFVTSSESFEDLQCILQTSETTVMLGGHQPLVIDFDLVTSKEIRKVCYMCSLLVHTYSY